MVLCGRKEVSQVILLNVNWNLGETGEEGGERSVLVLIIDSELTTDGRGHQVTGVEGGGAHLGCVADLRVVDVHGGADPAGQGQRGVLLALTHR